MLSTLSPAGKAQLNPASMGRNNSVIVGGSSNLQESGKVLSPITHSPMHLVRDGGSHTARPSNSKLEPVHGELPNFTKTTMQAREAGHVKPKAYNAWDILALNDLIKDKIENQRRRQKQ